MRIDFALDERVILENDLDCVIQEIDILFNTTNTELIGNPDYGTNFETFLWQTTPSEETLKKYVERKLEGCSFFNLIPYETAVQYIEDPTGQYDPMYKVTIILYDTDNNTRVTREYMY